VTDLILLTVITSVALTVLGYIARQIAEIQRATFRYLNERDESLAAERQEWLDAIMATREDGTARDYANLKIVRTAPEFQQPVEPEQPEPPWDGMTGEG